MTIGRVDLGAILVLLCASAAPAADLPDTQPASQPAGISFEQALGMLWSADADARRQGAEALGKLGDGRAVEPLLTLLQDSYVVRGRARIVPEASSRGPDAAAALRRRRQYHADRIRGETFLGGLLGHARAGEWTWVRSLGGQADPTALLGRLSGSLYCRPAGGWDVEVLLAGPRTDGLAGMLSMLMTMYSRDSRDRIEQRTRRRDLEGRLPGALAASDLDARALAAYQATGALVQAAAVLEQQKKLAEPLTTSMQRAKDLLEKANRAMARIEDEFKRRRKVRNDLEDQLQHARNMLVDAMSRRRPDAPDPNLETTIQLLQSRIADLDARLTGARRDEEEAWRVLGDARQDVSRRQDEVDGLDARIENLIGPAKAAYDREAAAFQKLQTASTKSQQALADVQKDLAALPPMADLEPADAAFQVVRPPTEVEQVDRAEPERRAAVEALVRITGQDFSADPEKWRTWQAQHPAPASQPAPPN
jgi:chromosome segregation ATPase